MSLLVAMAAIGLTWIALFFVVTSIGLGVRRLAGMGPFDRDELLLPFWTGWCSVLAFLQLWHLWLPVNDACLLAVGLLAAAAGAWEHSGWRRWCSAARETWQNRPIWLLATLFALFVVWTNLATSRPLHPDTGLYHLQAVRWTIHAPIVTGLGNLHDRFAFNNSSFLYAALLDAGPWSDRSHHLANGLLSFVLLTESVLRAAGVWQLRDRRWLHACWWAMLVPVIVLWSIKEISSLTPDLATFALSLVVSDQLLRLWLDDETGLAPMERHWTVGLLAAAGISVKLSFAPFLALGWLVSLGVALSRRRREIPDPNGWWLLGKAELVTVVTIAAVLVPWTVRGVYLSGYPAYPQTFGACDVPWRLPVERVMQWRDWWILAYARDPDRPPQEVLADWSWFAPWLAKQLRNVAHVSAPLAVLFVSLMAWGVENRRDAGKLPLRWPVLLALLPAAATLAAVLLKAPNPRYAGASLWIISATTSLLVLDSFRSRPLAFQRLGRGLAAVTFVLLAIAAARCMKYTRLPDGSPGLERLPASQVRAERSRDGLLVYVPQGDDKAWGAPLPSAPYLDPHLTTRRSGDIKSGFLVR